MKLALNRNIFLNVYQNRANDQENSTI